MADEDGRLPCFVLALTEPEDDRGLAAAAAHLVEAAAQDGVFDEIGGCGVYLFTAIDAAGLLHTVAFSLPVHDVYIPVRTHVFNLRGQLLEPYDGPIDAAAMLLESCLREMRCTTSMIRRAVAALADIPGHANSTGRMLRADPPAT